MRNKYKIIYLLILVLILFSACNETDRMTLDLETYYYVFDGLSKKATDSRRALLKVDIDLCANFDYGDSVVVGFQEDQRRLLLKTIVRPGPSLFMGNEYHLNGIFEGQDEESGDGLIGFKFHVTKAEHAATEFVKHSTNIVRVHFTSSEQNLLFERFEIIGETDTEPIMKK